MPELNIRIMTMADYQNVYQLWASTVGMGLRSLDDSEEGIGKFLERNPRTCFVAEAGAEIAGVILSGHDGRRGYIYHAAVRETDRGKGIGNIMVEAVEKAMRDEGINKISLVAYSDNERGNRFWERLGYQTRPDLSYRTKSINDENV
jgi:ribosomal protein S18 acetylase RimI-like enzyme